MNAVVEVPFVRRKRGKADVFVAPASPEPESPTTRVARMLALAHTMSSLLRYGTVGDQRELAAPMMLTRGRVTQLLDLTLLAPDIQEQILEGADPGIARITERALRSIVRLRCSTEQRRLWHAMVR